MDATPNLSIVVPVYRAHSSLTELCRRLIAICRENFPSFEILLVEDCGGDDSWSLIQQLAKVHSELRGIQLSRNFGQHAATLCGIAQARGEWIATIDDDLEHPPESLPAMMAKACEGYDLVYGVFPERSHHWWRNLTSNVARRLFRTAIPSLNYDYTSLRLIRGSIARALVTFDSPFPFVDGYLSWLTNRYAKVDVPHFDRAHGSSNYTTRKLVLHTLNILVTFSDLPLRLASWLGILSSLVGFAWLVSIVVERVVGHITASGYASLMAGIVFFGGLQLLVLGVVGQYIGRINFKSSRKPLFLIAHDTSSS
ncbi:glycosyltransferase family 2 protein [Rhodanobacter hydrolyticus]|uniref:Glycosyltransferase family 2 protein n=1 Tax=Rhodanobacter hydrolyticus TaxID=2250595 RepID=A0ABW8J921_9GAMM